MRHFTYSDDAADYLRQQGFSVWQGIDVRGETYAVIHGVHFNNSVILNSVSLIAYANLEREKRTAETYPVRVVQRLPLVDSVALQEARIAARNRGAYAACTCIQCRERAS